jgi:predicted ATPase
VALAFTHATLANWRNFSSANVELQRRVFLVGPNASGKSNFLDVFRFLHDIVAIGGGFQAAVARRHGVSGVRCLSARKYTDILVRVEVGAAPDQPAWSYELKFNQDNNQRPIIKTERVTRNGTTVLDRPNDADENDLERLTQTHLEQVTANKDFRELADFFQSVRYLHLVPQLIRDSDRSVGRRNDPYGGDFLEQIARTPTRTQNARLSRIRSALRVAVPQLEELELFRDDRGTPHLRGKYTHWRLQGAWQNEDDFSDGTLRLMGLLWALLSGAGPLLLEEPELSLHPGVIRYIPQMIARIQRRLGSQVLISTHSSDLLEDEGIGADEVLILQPEPEGTRITRVNEIREVKKLLEQGMTIAAAVMPRTRPINAEQLALFSDT